MRNTSLAGSKVPAISPTYCSDIWSHFPQALSLCSHFPVCQDPLGLQTNVDLPSQQMEM